MTTLDKKLINLIYSADKNAATVAYAYLNEPTTDQNVVADTFVYLHSHSAFLGSDKYADFQMKMMASGYYDEYPDKIKWYTSAMYSITSTSLIQKMYLTWINAQPTSDARANFLDRKLHNKTTIFIPKALQKTYPFGAKLKKPHEASRFLHDFIRQDNYTFSLRYLKALNSKHPDKWKLFYPALVQELNDSAEFMTRDQNSKNSLGLVTFINDCINCNLVARSDAPPEWIGFLFRQSYPSLATSIYQAKYQSELNTILSLYTADDLKNPQLWRHFDASSKTPAIETAPLPTI